MMLSSPLHCMLHILRLSLPWLLIIFVLSCIVNINFTMYILHCFAEKQEWTNSCCLSEGASGLQVLYLWKCLHQSQAAGPNTGREGTFSHRYLFTVTLRQKCKLDGGGGKGYLSCVCDMFVCVCIIIISENRVELFDATWQLVSAFAKDETI